MPSQWTIQTARRIFGVEPASSSEKVREPPNQPHAKSQQQSGDKQGEPTLGGSGRIGFGWFGRVE